MAMNIFKKTLISGTGVAFLDISHALLTERIRGVIVTPPCTTRVRLYTPTFRGLIHREIQENHMI